jgi:propanol-preferring alcohol dehydrogenase
MSLPRFRSMAAIIFASVGSLVPQALRAVTKGGVDVCASIHMSDIPSFPFVIC